MATDTRRSESYYETKGTVFGALIEAIDLAQLARLDADAAREEIRDIVNEIIAMSGGKKFALQVGRAFSISL